MHSSAHHLLLHGLIVLLVGLLYGAPYGRAINRGAPESLVHAWRVAHASLPIGAVVMLAVSAVLSGLAVTEPIKWFIAITLIASSYAFCFSLPLAAVTGHRGLSYEDPLAAKCVYLGNAVGAVLSLLSTVLLIYAAFVSL